MVGGFEVSSSVGDLYEKVSQVRRKRKVRVRATRLESERTGKCSVEIHVVISTGLQGRSKDDLVWNVADNAEQMVSHCTANNGDYSHTYYARPNFSFLISICGCEA
jgi:hypothetical protein